VVGVKDPYGSILRFLDWNPYFLFHVTPVTPGPLLLRKSGSAENRTEASGSVARNSDQ
jgi:hypothetical protein